MRKIGDYADTFVKENGIWYEKHVIGRVVLDGTETWEISSTNTSGYNRFTTTCLYTSIKKPSYSSENGYMISNYFINKSADDTYARIDGISVGTNGNLYVYDDNFKSYTDIQFKTWLSENNATLYYQLEEPTLLPCTAEQTAVLGKIYNEAKTYKDGTYIYSTDEISPYFKVEYYQDISKEIAEIQQAIIELGGII